MQVLGTTALIGNPVPLNALLSTCVDAARLGCREIRAVQANRESNGLDVMSKPGEEFRYTVLTEADLAAQQAIVSALRAAWPGLLVVGEEDDAAAAEKGVPGEEPPVLSKDLCADAACERAVPMADIAVFVDPLDGTREFVEGRLGNVQAVCRPRRRRPPAAALTAARCQLPRRRRRAVSRRNRRRRQGGRRCGRHPSLGAGEAREISRDWARL